MDLWHVFKTALTITAFVAVIMIAIEYINIQTRGLVMRALGEAPWRQYVLALLLGAAPGCLGAGAVLMLTGH